MTSIARVIVDVPSRQTDRPFDYRIPAEWLGWVEVGSRVTVPFGPRLVQGFVVDLAAESEMDADKLKNVAEVLDLVPPLTPELVELGKWMSDTYLCPEVVALQAMIPSALKARYDRVLRLADGWQDAGLDLLESDICAFIGEKGQRTDKVLSRFPGAERIVKDLIKRDIVRERQVVEDKLKPKTALFVVPAEDGERLRERIAELGAGAKRQREVLARLADRPEAVPLAQLAAELGVSSATIRSLEAKGWIRIELREVQRDPYGGREFRRTEPLAFTEEQQSAYDAIMRELGAGRYARFLLHGVTGSGKTEVYLQAIQSCMEQGREAIVLVPEISLTPQMVDRFKGRFGDRVAVLHSRLSPGERYDEWRKIQRRQVSVVVGARSAVFAPFTKLGLIIIDEEHESSYKQEESPKYEAGAVAAQRAMRHGAVVVLGSATPSLESYAEAAGGRGAVRPDAGAALRLIAMPSRVGGRPLPAVRVVDMREELLSGNRSMFSRPLQEAIRLRLERGEQTVLLLNRRGYATFVLCRSCGHAIECPHCDIALTYHMNTRMMRCHYCGYAEREQPVCPSCGSEHIRQFGTGTQRVEEELAKQFAGLRIIRMDVDTTSAKGAHEKLLGAFRDRKADVLLGTQMVAKGLDFPAVTLVGVIAADSALYLPDFRSAEKTFQLVTQVAGRAGRHQLPGEVIVQTYNPGHYSIKAASGHDYAAFAETELAHRYQHGYPPYSRLILISLAHERQNALVRAGEAIARSLRDGWNEYANRHRLDPDALHVLGPVPSPIPRLKDRYRFQCMVKYRGDLPAAGLVRRAVDALRETAEREQVVISIDVDPHNMM